MSEVDKFKKEVAENIDNLGKSNDLKELSFEWIEKTAKYNYSYNFSWLGRPLIQFPQDIVAFQELVWTIKPDLIIETGIAHGGSLIMNASYLALLDYTEAIESNQKLTPTRSKRKILGIDIDIRKHNKNAILAHPLSSMIEMIEGSSVDSDIVKQVHEIASGFKKVMVILDSNHTHDHVLSELNLYSNLVSKGSYCVVLDTAIDDMPEDMFPDRPWGKEDNPKTAVHEFLKQNPKFEIDKAIEDKLLITVAPSGFLKRVL